MFELGLLGWTVVVLVFILTGINKTGLPTLGILTVTMMMFVFPVKTAVGIMLPMLLTADIFAVIYYRRNAHWRLIFKLLPWVLVGLAAGYVTLQLLNGDLLRKIIGFIVLLLIVLQLLRNRFGTRFNEMLPESRIFAALMGILGGFTTMVGNAAGEVMSIYFLAKKLPQKEFVGTVAWFFFTVNIIKLPIFIHLGMITATTFKFDLALAPLVIIGAFIGVNVLPRLPKRIFEGAILLAAAIGGVLLLFT
ncbi:sulfite exporter TauE/SafE family protein [Aciduricibacillus chroicocephali]|uniref:Probable membrane transporter protein n=1 Tax=Aciduricibacillus chroicocephali TaxID=3054939 RepID=A0ABY9KZY6_9BACI|nr:sulfite exporter TauE/SafE family protein [Bacillaceae bacterium 44XB]